jgi:hypothetical protein
MKRLFLIAALLLTALSFNSCEEDQWGYDNRVIFTAQGGEEDIDGEDAIHTLSIGSPDGKEEFSVEVGNIMTAKLDWLTAIAIKGDNEIQLIAEPNETGKKRKLYVYGMIRNKVMDITVIQDK